MPVTSDQLLDAAVPVLTRDRGASMKEIATAAGISRTTLIRFFPTRDALMAALARRAVAEATRVLDAAALEHGPVREAFAALTQGFVPIAQVWGLAYVDQQVPADPGLQDAADRVGERIDAFFARAQSEGFVRQDLPAQWLSYSFSGLAETATELIREGLMGPKQAPGYLAQVLLDGAAAR
ncbi:TetR/AcrR family transcriptional regulator [Streptomyces sp. NPDC059011]|uniref:TetR/AcrR family transcriptional regulator n=1 Tax=unclassified Streptomyces TaxID=2593676 RepID=UPI0036A15588